MNGIELENDSLPNFINLKILYPEITDTTLKDVKTEGLHSLYFNKNIFIQDCILNAIIEQQAEMSALEQLLAGSGLRRNTAFSKVPLCY